MYNLFVLIIFNTRLVLHFYASIALLNGVFTLGNKIKDLFIPQDQAPH